jgi:L-ascorbate metabolism protein UlaG (beta-lactamase superfamily)
MIALVAAAPLNGQSTKTAMQQDPACQSLTPVSAGGPAPNNADIVVVRWLSHMNYELAYRGNVFLLDAYYDQTPRRPPIGVDVGDLKKANAIFISHSHFDHVSDAPRIARQTGATIVGAVVGNEAYVTRNGVAPKQFKAVTNADVLHFQGVVVETVLGSHNSPQALGIPADYVQKQQAAIQAASLQQPFTESEKKRDAEIRARGDDDPKIAAEGVIDYLFTFGNGFRVMFIGSHGGITDAQRQLARRVPSVDVALVPYLFFDAGIPPLIDLVKLLKPSTVFLGNQDGIGTMGWASNYPPALAIREVSPKTRTMDVIYRTPVCFNTASKQMFFGG